MKGVMDIYTDIMITNKRYPIIYADPPWRYEDKRCQGACENHYATMTLSDICNLPVARIAADVFG